MNLTPTQTNNTMTQYEQVRSKIIEAVPEIMELKFGCKIKVQSGEVLNYGVGLQDGWYKGNLMDVDEGCGCCSDHTTFKKGTFEILGREITIADVLRAMDKAEADYFIDMGGMFVKQNTTLVDGDSPEYTQYKWDLAHDSLSWHAENRPEVIDFLAEILN